MNRHPLFVYGTLLRGQPNHVLLKGRTERILSGWMEGVDLYSLGTFPMMVEGQGRVLGEVVYVRSEREVYTATLTLLDQLEGVDRTAGLYRRVLRPTHLAPDRTILTWVYLGQIEMVHRRSRIKGGDWAAYVATSVL